MTSARCLRTPDASATFAERIARRAQTCLDLEVDTWPKPGLVSHVDNGSHDDMNAALLHRSAAAITPYFAELTRAGGNGAPLSALRRIGLRAEQAMLRATHGINTHRGAIFGLGLLCAAAGVREARASASQATLGSIVAQRWGNEVQSGPRPSHSHGEQVRGRYGAGGARLEAAHGFPSVYAIGVPALCAAAQHLPQQAEAWRVHATLALLARVEDTNLLHRGGLEGLAFAQGCARAFIERGGVGHRGWRDEAADIHAAFVARRLSPGGVADLLAMSLFVAGLDGASGVIETSR